MAARAKPTKTQQSRVTSAKGASKVGGKKRKRVRGRKR